MKAESPPPFSADGRWAARSSISRARCSIGAPTCSSTANLDNIAKSNPEIALNRDGTLDQSKYWFNTGGLRDSGRCATGVVPEAAFPFRVDGVRGPGLFLVNTNIVRNFRIGGARSLQFRLDVQNLFDAVLWNNPELNPTNTNFGKVTGATNSIMRFFTFVWKVNF